MFVQLSFICKYLECLNIITNCSLFIWIKKKWFKIVWLNDFTFINSKIIFHQPNSCKKELILMKSSMEIEKY